MIDNPVVKTLVLGVGNRLVSDEGIGIHVIEHLAANYILPEEVMLLDGGTLGLDLLYYIEGSENLLIIDAVETGHESGFMVRLEDEQVPAFLSLKMSPHQVGVPDMLFAAKLKGVTPKRLVLLGIQPELLEIGLDLSPTISARLDELVVKMIVQLQDWGHEVRLKS